MPVCVYRVYYQCNRAERKISFRLRQGGGAYQPTAVNRDTYDGLYVCVHLASKAYVSRPCLYSTKYATTIGGTALVKLIMGIVFNRINKKHKSDIIKNLSVDSFLDFFMSFCIVISFTLTSKFGYAIDSVMGLVAAAIVIISGSKSFSASCKVAVGKRDDNACEKAQALIKNVNGVAEITDLQCHAYGDRKIIAAEITVTCGTAKETAELTKLLNNIIKDNLGYDLQITIGGVL